MSIKENLANIKTALPKNVTLVAVSKTKPVGDLMEAYSAGQRIFGENKVQELFGKWEALPKDIQWHAIGHLQSNKVKHIAPFISLIHGVDSLKLLQEIDKQAKKNNRVIDCLLQIYIAEEESKFGLNKVDIDKLLQSDMFLELQNIKIVGLMGIATFTSNMEQVKKEFLSLKNIFDDLQSIKTYNFALNTLSMGMSDDYLLAIECGSTMVRIGSSIFGRR